MSEIILELNNLKIPAKKNNYKSVKGHWYKPKEILLFEETILYELKMQMKKYKIEFPFKNPVEITMFFECDSERADLDNKFTTLQDILKKVGIIKDDNLKWVSKGTFEGIKGKTNQTKIYISEV